MRDKTTTLRILLLEDSPLDAELTGARLAEGGIDGALFRVETREDFQAALEREPWDLILADFSLPAFDGIAALAIARERCPEVPFLFVSGALGEELAIEMLKSGATDYVLKQRLERLVPSVRRALREAAERVERRRAEESLRFLAEASSVLSATLDYEKTLASIARLAVPFLADWCGVDLLEEDGTFRRVAVAHVDPAKEALIREIRERYPPDPEAPFGPPHVLRTGEPELAAEISDAMLAESAQDAEHLQMIRGLGIRSGMCVPLVARGRALGAINFVISESGRRYGQADLELAGDLARRAALAIDNARLYHEVQLGDRRKDEFLAMLAHELRNPLAPILHAAEVMHLRDLPDPTLQRARDVIERQVQHMARLVDDLLDVSRITRGNVDLRQELVELADIVEHAVQTSKPLLASRQHTLAVSLPPEPLRLQADPLRLEQVLANLLNNAAKYTEPGGRIWLTATRRGGSAVIQVRDTGVGIRSEMLPHVFDLFLQVDPSLDRSQGGLGLGLTLVRRLVERHGGSVGAASAGPGKGSTFTVRLPLAADEDPRPEATTCRIPLSHASCGSGTRVLVIEDNADSRETLRDLLELWGHQVEVAETGSEGVRLALQHPFDAVLIDIGLPGLDGYEVARRLRGAETERPPAADGTLPPRPLLLIALTGYGQPEDRRRAHEAGFDTHLVKPVDPAELEALLARLNG